jgi:hypothetical protein
MQSNQSIVPTAEEYNLSPAQVAAILKVGIRTLKNWRARKVGPPYLRLERNIWYSYKALDTWLQDRITH